MYAYSQIEYETQIMNEFIEKEMQLQKKRALKTISSAVHFEVESFANILAYSWMDSVSCAKKIADEMNLSKLDFLAIQEEFEDFKQEYLMNKDTYYEHAI